MSAGFLSHVQDHMVMQPDGFGRSPTGDPSIANVAGCIPEEELIGALQGRDNRLAIKQPCGRLHHGGGISSKPVERHHKQSLGIHNVRLV